MKSAGVTVEGHIISFNGVLARAKLWPVSIYQLVEATGDPNIKFIVTGFETDTALLMPLNGAEKISSGLRITVVNDSLELRLGDDVLVETISYRSSSSTRLEQSSERIPLFQHESARSSKLPITEQFKTGLKALDWIMPIGVGQRLVIIANAGVGKSTFLKYLLKHAEYDVACVGLIGERTREVVEFVEDIKNHKLQEKIKVVASPSDSSPLIRYLSCLSVTRLAQHYSLNGKKVLLLVDSLTRVARAIREIGLQNGEIPVKQGLTPSVFITLPQILEQPGNFEHGSVTAFYTLLTNESHDTDYLAEETKSLVDGHIVLDRTLAERGVLPAVDIISSMSRVWDRFLSQEEITAINRMKGILKTLEKDRDLIFLAEKPPAHLLQALEVENLVHEMISQALSYSINDQDRSLFFKKIKYAIERYDSVATLNPLSEHRNVLPTGFQRNRQVTRPLRLAPTLE